MTSDCNADTGCGVSAAEANSYGPSFNSNGGGWYAMERTNSFIKVWFWPRSGSPPSDVSTSGSGSVNTDKWGTPSALFPSTSCDISSKFSPNNIIINLTLCGSWAGVVYGDDGCPGDCVSESINYFFFLGRLLMFPLRLRQHQPFCLRTGIL